jgi:hypothetical protein
VSLGNQSFADLNVVIDLAIENYPNGFIFIANGLRATFQIDDGKTGVAKQAAAAHACETRAPVGATML